MKEKFRKRYWMSALALLILYYLAAYGPLFPWSPIKPGYTTFSSQNYSVVYSHEAALPDFYKSLVLPTNEQVKIIRADQKDLAKYIPFIRTEHLESVMLRSDDVVYINYERIHEANHDEEAIVKNILDQLNQDQENTK